MDKEKIMNSVEKHSLDLIKVADSIWDNPEIAFHEEYAVEKLQTLLAGNGFSIEQRLVGIPTAFKATYGQGTPVIALLGEYDALDGLSQIENSNEKKAREGQTLGQGCGHHLIGAGAAGAAIAVKEYLESSRHQGTVVFYGCPGEEGGSGKSFMVRDGAFKGVDCALTWHPSDLNNLFSGRCLSLIGATFKFTGVAAHAAGMAHMGKSALDAVELMDVGCNYLREHMPNHARLHYAIIDTGGKSPNVVQPSASVYYYIRAIEPEQVKELYDRVCNVAKGAALMTGTCLDIRFNRGVSGLLPNECLDDLMQSNLEGVPLPTFSKEDFKQATDIRETMAASDETFNEMIAQMSRKEAELVRPFKNRVISDYVVPRMSTEPVMYGSTDVGDVSMICPTSQIHAAVYAAGTQLHTWQAVAQGKSHIAHKGMLYASKVLALSAVALIEDASLVQAASKEFWERRGNRPFIPLMDRSVEPLINR